MSTVHLLNPLGIGFILARHGNHSTVFSTKAFFLVVKAENTLGYPLG
jgi:hypothetical protein